MECLRERPRPRGTASHSEGTTRHSGGEELENKTQTSGQENIESGEDTDQDGGETVDDQRDENSARNDSDTLRNKELSDSEKEALNSLNGLLSEQEGVFKTEEECVKSKKDEAKENISNMFSKFQELLAQKKNELLEKVDFEYDIADSLLSDFVSNIAGEKQKVSELLANGRLSNENEGVLDIEQIKEDLDASINFRNDILNQFRVPYFVLHEQCLDKVSELNIGDFQEFSTSYTDQTEEGNAGRNMNSAIAIDENVSGTVNDVTAESSPSGAGINTNTERTEEGIGEVAEGGESVENKDKQSEACGATEISDEVLSPSAPPIMPEEAPPPYWQAMGLHGPQEQTQPRSEIPGYFDIPHSPSNRLPDNKLELWHSFPVRRQYDRRGPLCVALTWNHGKICVADRANMRVKFFSHNGQLITEMYFSGIEIHDVAFLEESQGESRYVLSSPKSKTLIIIGIDNWNTPKVIRKLAFAKAYSCVSRGPKVQTLIGAEVTPKSGMPVVSMFSFTGQVLLSISHTPSFVFLQYIKSVQVIRNHIVVLDWKINSVSVFQDDGAAVGEYKGTANSPLINPLDMTLDNHGNILILNGEFSNIHVIDLHCNPVEIIQLPRNVSSSATAKFIAFDLETRRLAVARTNGDVAVFTFQNGYDCLPQRNLPPNVASEHDSSSGRRPPEVLPLVEGMLPSTIEDIITRQPVRNRTRQFHL